jgi:hypothetical protein
MFFRNRNRIANVKLWVVLGMVSLLHAPSLRCDEVNDYVQAQMRWERIPGVSIAVVRDGKVLRSNGYGFSNLETNTLAAPDTVYKMGSLSKQFLAAGLMVLVQDGRVNLDDSVSKYLPSVPETWKAITVRNLLIHTSGIARDSAAFDPLKLQPDDEVIRSVYPVPLQFPPGSRFSYSPALKTADSPALPDTGAARSSSIRLLLSDLAAGKLPTDSVTPELRSELAEQKDAGAFEALQSFGPVLSADLIQQQTKDGRPIYTFRVAYRSITLFAECSVNADNKLSRFGLHD